MKNPISIIILAAGQGTRMRSALPKVMHSLAGVPMLIRVIQSAMALKPEHIYVVCGHERDQIRAQCQAYPITWIEQKEQLGTGDAVRQVLPLLKNPAERILILYGDVPLIQTKTLENLLENTEPNALGLLTVVLNNPTGMGRIVRESQGKILKIVEEKDATPEQKAIIETNTGIYVMSAENLQRWVPKIKANNAQKEFYLTDIISIAVAENAVINVCEVVDKQEVQGVNDRQQLIMLERFYQIQQANQLLLSGVTIIDPTRFDLRGKAKISQDVLIDINVILEGDVEIASGTIIGSNCYLKNVHIGKNVEIKPNCVIENATIGNDCKVGPFARIRPDTVLSDGVTVGNFVEIKKSQIGKGSKIPHLSYVGDTTMGENVNFGAGAITCNYDGVNKHQTVIGNHVFIGSDSQLIAPIIIEDDAFIGAGSTISKNAPANKLTLSRSKQQTLDQWQRPVKKEEK